MSDAMLSGMPAAGNLPSSECDPGTRPRRRGGIGHLLARNKSQRSKGGIGNGRRSIARNKVVTDGIEEIAPYAAILNHLQQPGRTPSQRRPATST